MYPLLKEPRILKLQPQNANLYLENKNLKGSISINESAYSILSLCDSSNSIDEIIDTLVIKYNEKRSIVSEFVSDFISMSLKIGTVEMVNQKVNKPISIFGSRDYWSPDALIIELTYNCILSCKHCYLDAGNKKANISMDYNVLVDLCNQFKTLKIDRVQLTGGEPLIYPHVDDIINRLNDANIYTIIVTSGIYSNENIYSAINNLRNQSGKIQISLDGMKKTHNVIRGNPESFDKAINFIKKVTNMGVEVDVATTLFEQSFEEIEELICYVNELGVRRLRLGLVIDKGRAQNISPINMDEVFFTKCNEFRNAMKLKYNSNTFQITTDEEVPENNTNCGAGYKLLRIDPDLNVHPCSLIDYPIDNLNNITLEKFFKEYTNSFEALVSPNEGICKKCEKLIMCNKCFAQGLVQSNKVSKCKWIDSQKDLINHFIR